MKRAIITIALVLICAKAFCQPSLLSQSEGNSLYYLPSSGTYALSLKNMEGGEDIIVTLYKTEDETTGIFDIMLGVASGIYPDYIGIYQGQHYALMFKNGNGSGIGVECGDKFGSISTDTILKFRGALEARK